MYSIWKIMCFLNIKECQHFLLHSGVICELLSCNCEKITILIISQLPCFICYSVVKMCLCVYFWLMEPNQPEPINNQPSLHLLWPSSYLWWSLITNFSLDNLALNKAEQSRCRYTSTVIQYAMMNNICNVQRIDICSDQQTETSGMMINTQCYSNIV